MKLANAYLTVDARRGLVGKRMRFDGPDFDFRPWRFSMYLWILLGIPTQE